MEEVKIGLLGFGTVGSGVYELLQKNADLIKERIGIKPVVKKILVKDLKKERKINNSKLFTTNIEDILNDPEIGIICELIGGIQPAKDFIIKALKEIDKLDVVTSPTKRLRIME